MITVTEDQALYFRARRSHLVGPGAPDAASAARTVIGLQAQQLEPALIALSQRIAGRPSVEALTRDLFAASPRTLVRTWGQRDTVHLYDAAAHWSWIVAAREHWTTSGRRGPMPDQPALDAALEHIESLGRPVARKDLYELAPPDYLEAVAEIASNARQTPEHFAAGRLLWRLAQLGAVSTADKVGSAQRYAARSLWFPALPWPAQGPAPDAACATLTRDYLAVYGPATAADVAHHFGARITKARCWVAALAEAGELLDVDCGDRRGLVALRIDAESLAGAPPEPEAWPVRLLPKFDTMLMGHADKTWTVPHEPDRKQIWRKAANVMGTVLARGRLVAVWTLNKRARAVTVTVEPLRSWRPSEHRAGVESEAQTLAGQLGRAGASVIISEPC